MFLFGRNDFLSAAENGRVAPLIWAQEVKGSPLSALRSLAAKIRPPYCLLESAGGGMHLTRYSFIGGESILTFRSKNGQSVVSPLGKAPYLISFPHPFLALRELSLQLAPSQKLPLELPFWGGALGFLSYDAGRHLEKLPSLAQDDLGLPDMSFIFPGLLLVFDHQESLMYVIANELIKESPQASYRAACRRLRKALDLLEQESKNSPDRSFPAVEVSSNLGQSDFEAMVRRTIEYIHAGDVYQVNLSQRLEVPFTQDPLLLYEGLREINPSPFAAYLDGGDFQLVSSSPERLIMLRGKEAATRPIAGTRPRGDGEPEEKRLSQYLLLDEKERAEHIMLVDLERNDLGRVCRYGTVCASELMILEKYSHVIHIVSNVKGELSEDKDQFDLIQAMFPGGTITGCPKVRCMEIIDELEPIRRGPYTGSIGYFGFNGEMDMNIVIRTILLKDKKAFAQVGAGIVADSRPEREYIETLHKAEAMLRALNATSYPLYAETKKVFL